MTTTMFHLPRGADYAAALASAIAGLETRLDQYVPLEATGRLSDFQRTHLEALRSHLETLRREQARTSGRPQASA